MSEWQPCCLLAEVPLVLFARHKCACFHFGLNPYHVRRRSLGNCGFADLSGLYPWQPGQKVTLYFFSVNAGRTVTVCCAVCRIQHPEANSCEQENASELLEKLTPCSDSHGGTWVQWCAFPSYVELGGLCQCTAGCPRLLPLLNS